MNGYVCVKACSFGGVVYNKGDAIPPNAVLPLREKALIGQGYIARTENVENLISEIQQLKARIADMEEAQLKQVQPEMKQEVEVSKNKSRKR